MDLRYFLKGLLLPPFSHILVLVFALAVRRYAKRFSNILLVLTLLSLWLLSCPIVAVFLAKSVEVNSPLNPQKLSTLQADAIVVLSAGQRNYAPEFGQPVSGSEMLDRLRYGAYLQRETGLPMLLSGGQFPDISYRSLAETMRYDLVENFNGNATWLEKKSRTTAENAFNSFEILSSEKKTTIILVTSSLHMKRSRWIFEEAGFSVTAAPTHFADYGRITVNSFMPNANSLSLSSQVLHEWLGFFVYHFHPM